MSVCLLIDRPSHASIVSKWQKVPTDFLPHLVPAQFQFFRIKRCQYRNGDPMIGALSTWGLKKSQFLTNISLLGDDREDRTILTMERK